MSWRGIRSRCCGRRARARRRLRARRRQLRERSRLFFSSLPVGPSNLGRLEFTERADFLEARGDAYIGATNALQRLEGELERLREVEEAAGLRKRAADIRNHLKFLLESTDPNTVFWIERRATWGCAMRRVRRCGGRQQAVLTLRICRLRRSMCRTFWRRRCSAHYPTRDPDLGDADGGRQRWRAGL